MWYLSLGVASEQTVLSFLEAGDAALSGTEPVVPVATPARAKSGEPVLNETDEPIEPSALVEPPTKKTKLEGEAPNELKEVGPLPETPATQIVEDTPGAGGAIDPRGHREMGETRKAIPIEVLFEVYRSIYCLAVVTCKLPQYATCRVR